MYSNRVTAIKDEIDIDWQLIAADLDTSVNTMRYLHKDAEYDALKCEQFDALVNDIENVEGIECIKVSPLDSEVLTLDFCVNVIDRISESDPNNAYYIKA